MNDFEKCTECSGWTRASGKILTNHHPNCSQYNLEDELVNLIKQLINGIECWAGDEDGVHPECWSAYEEAKIRLGEQVLDKIV